MLDFLDPNNWVADTHEHRVYGDAHAQTWAVVDAIDYPFLVRWQWSPKVSRGGKKIYLRRNLHTTTAPSYYSCDESSEDGRLRVRGRLQQTLFLHQAVMERAGSLPPSPLHVMIDHLDGDGMNCRRANLRWATIVQNRHNQFGSLAVQETLTLEA